MKTNIKTLDEFANIINEADEWKAEFNEIINANGWEDQTGEQWGICSDGKERLVFNDEAQAVIVPNN